jgi:SSS family solute:Na+ symporter
MFAAVSFVFFTALVAVVTWCLVRKSDVTHGDGYFLGSRSLPWFVVAGSMMLTNISTEQLVGLNGGAYLSGVNVMGWEVIAAVALVVLALVLLPIYMRYGIVTVPQLLESRYSPAIRSLYALVVMAGLLLTFLPFVLYTGSLSLVSLFRFDEVMGLDTRTAVLLGAVALAVVGGCYAVFGGLKAVAVSDTINGVGLIVGGATVTVLGMLYLGDGSILESLRVMREGASGDVPGASGGGDRLNAISGPESSVPFSTLFTGMLLINVSYWCLNQNIIQRTFGARSLADGQKGVLFAGLLKILGVFILVLPGILAYHIFKGELSHGDLAYPKLVELVLPVWMTGFFGAVLFGAILSSFNSALHSLATLFSVDIYKPLIRKAATDTETVVAGKVLAIGLIVVSIAVVPLLHETTGGIFDLMKRLGGFLFAGSFSTVVIGLMFKRTTPVAPFVGFPLGAVVFGWFAWYRGGVLWKGGDWVLQWHWLHVHAANAALVFVVMMAIRWLIPPPEVTSEGAAREAARITADVDMTPWRWAKPAGIALLLIVVSMYVIFSPLVLG